MSSDAERAHLLSAEERNADTEPGAECEAALGRHLNTLDTTLLIVGRIVGSGIFSIPSFVLAGVGSPGAALSLWLAAALLSYAGLYIWIEYGVAIPRSGGEKVYLGE